MHIFASVSLFALSEKEKDKKGKAKEIREREKMRNEKETQRKLLHSLIRERTISLRIDGGLRYQSIMFFMLFMSYAFNSDISIYG